MPYLPNSVTSWAVLRLGERQGRHISCHLITNGYGSFESAQWRHLFSLENTTVISFSFDAKFTLASARLVLRDLNVCMFIDGILRYTKSYKYEMRYNLINSKLHKININ